MAKRNSLLVSNCEKRLITGGSKSATFSGEKPFWMICRACHLSGTDECGTAIGGALPLDTLSATPSAAALRVRRQHRAADPPHRRHMEFSTGDSAELRSPPGQAGEEPRSGRGDASSCTSALKEGTCHKASFVQNALERSYRIGNIGVTAQNLHPVLLLAGKEAAAIFRRHLPFGIIGGKLYTR